MRIRKSTGRLVDDERDTVGIFSHFILDAHRVDCIPIL